MNQALDLLEKTGAWSYLPDGSQAVEPTALAALALGTHGRIDAMRRGLQWLAARQSTDGGVSDGPETPRWPTSLAVLAWRRSSPATEGAADNATYAQAIERGIHWLLGARGEIEASARVFGHDTTLIGWPWVEGTHSWVEPTALSVLALKATGHEAHGRTREGVKLLFDRLLPNGGCNYGNTWVLGRQLRAHVGPTGLSLLALAGESGDDKRIAQALHYLESELSERTSTASLCYGLMGLTAHGRRPPRTGNWLETVFHRTVRRGAGALSLSLLCLAAAGASNCPLIIARTERGVAHESSAS